MKKIGIISDTHSYMDERIENYLSVCDEVWHAGDIGSLEVLDRLNKISNLKSVYGNIDGQSIRIATTHHLAFEVEGLKVVMIHIAGAFGKYNPKTLQLIRQYKPDILVCGHSHIAKVKRDALHHLLYINPGAAGKQGFHHMRTILRFNIDNGSIVNMELIELGKRGG